MKLLVAPTISSHTLVGIDVGFVLWYNPYNIRGLSSFWVPLGLVVTAGIPRDPDKNIPEYYCFVKIFSIIAKLPERNPEMFQVNITFTLSYSDKDTIWIKYHMEGF